MRLYISEIFVIRFRSSVSSKVLSGLIISSIFTYHVAFLTLQLGYYFILYSSWKTKGTLNIFGRQINCNWKIDLVSFVPKNKTKDWSGLLLQSSIVGKIKGGSWVTSFMSHPVISHPWNMCQSGQMWLDWNILTTSDRSTFVPPRQWHKRGLGEVIWKDFRSIFCAI